MTLQIKLVLLEPGHVELLAGCATLQLAGDVLFIVFDDPKSGYKQAPNEWSRSGYVLGDYTCGADALGSLCHQEFPFFLNRGVDVVSFVGTVWQVIVSNVVYLMLFQEVRGDDPGAIGNNLVNPFAMT